MINKIGMFKIICLILMVILSIQMVVYAAEVGDVICKAATVVIGAALVIAGVVAVVGVAGSVASGIAAGKIGSEVAIAIGVGNLAGGVGIIDTGVDMINMVIPPEGTSGGGRGGDGGSGGSGGPPPLPGGNPRDIKNFRFTIDIQSTSEKGKKIAVIQLKDISDGASITVVPGYNSWVSHSYGQIKMVLGGESSGSKPLTASSPDFVAFSNIPDVTATGFPSVIQYALQKQCQLVKMEILDSSGSVVYAFAESSPNPAKPIPFIWNGKGLSGNNVAAGAYSVRLKAVKNDGSTEQSPISIMSVGDPIDADKGKEIVFNSEGKAYVTFFNTSGSSISDFIFVKLKDQAGNVITEEKKAVDFEGADAPQQAAQEYALPDVTQLNQTVDSMPLRMEMYGKDNPDFGKFRMTFYPDDAGKRYVYEYDTASGGIKVFDANGSVQAYSENINGNEYIIAMSVFSYYARKMFEAGGYSLDADTGAINVDSAVLGHKVAVQTIGEKILVNIDGMDYQYDPSSDKVLTADKVGWGDIVTGNLGGGGVQTSGIAAKDTKATVTTVNLMFFTAICLRQGEGKAFYKLLYYAKKVASGEKFTPLEKPVLPEITDADPNVDYSKVSLYGKGKNGANIKVIVNGADAGSVKWPNSSDKWEATDIPLDYGMNKIHVRAESGYEKFKVNSRAISAVRGGGGTGYDVSMVLIYPAEYQVIGCEFPLTSPGGFDQGLKVLAGCRVKGRIEKEGAIIVNGKNVNVGDDGVFDAILNVGFHEGENNLSIKAVNSGKVAEYSQKVIGALKFTQFNSNTKQNETYIIRPGDFLFNEDIGLLGMAIPLFPDHTGIYIGGGYIIEAIKPSIKYWTLYDDPNEGEYKVNDNSFYGKGKHFYGVTRVPYFEEENTFNYEIRKKAAETARGQKGKSYDIPINYYLLPLLYGKFNGPQNGFYCSELAYWSWEQTIGPKIEEYIPLHKVLFPMNDPNKASLLPALLYLNTWIGESDEK